jgi:translation initiation factor 5B
LGQVDHGKTTLLDNIRGTSVALREPGQITQWIGASLVPSEVLDKICKDYLDQFNFKVNIPGLLFIDTPGHESFSNLRKRGGSAADIAILVVDINKGVEPQSLESIEILKLYKTPFLVAANKIDLISGWRRSEEETFVKALESNPPEVRRDLENKLYSLMGTLSRLGFKTERFDKIRDFTKHIAIIPTSAKTAEGIPELLAILVGLTQSFMKEDLITVIGPAKGTVLEVKEEIGLGTTINVIIFDGTLKTNDRIVIGGSEGPIITEVRAILIPKPLDEIRDPKDKFSIVNKVNAAAGIKIAAPNLDLAVAGSPLYVVEDLDKVEDYSELVREEIENLRIKTDKLGITLKADTLGSLEAIINSLSKSGIPIRLADIGDISKRDIIEAETVMLKDHLLGVVLAFNVKILPDAKEEAKRVNVPIFLEKIIYRLIENYSEWKEREKIAGMEAELRKIVRPGKIKILLGCTFRRSKPAIVGIEVLSGRIKPHYTLMLENGKKIGSILRIQDEKKDLNEAIRGMQISASIDDAVIGRNIFEGNILYVDVPDTHQRILLKNFKDSLSSDEIELLNEMKEKFSFQI